MKLKAFSIAAVIAAMATGAFAEGQLRVGTEGAYPPWSMADASGNVTGFDADVANLICAKLEKECVFVVQAFDGLIPALKAHQFDVIISGMSITDERSTQIDFSVPYVKLTNLFVVKKGSDLTGIEDIPTVLESLNGLKVGTQGATTQANFVTKLSPGADLKTYDTLDQQWIDLVSGRIDVSFADAVAALDFLKTPDGQGFEAVKAIVPDTYDETLGLGVGVGISKDTPELKAEIDTALCELVADGSIGKSSMKWFELDISRPCN